MKKRSKRAIYRPFFAFLGSFGPQRAPKRLKKCSFERFLKISLNNYLNKSKKWKNAQKGLYIGLFCVFGLLWASKRLKKCSFERFLKISLNNYLNKSKKWKNAQKGLYIGLFCVFSLFYASKELKSSELAAYQLLLALFSHSLPGSSLAKCEKVSNTTFTICFMHTLSHLCAL